MSHIDRYTCEDLIRKLDDYLDRRLSEDEVRLVLEHLATCVFCTMEYNFETAVLEELKDKVKRIETPPGLKDRIFSRLRDTEKDES